METARAVGEMIKRFLEHPVTGLAAGVVLAAAGIDDLLEALAAADYSIGVHHGLILLGLFKVLSALAETLERLSSVAERLD
ncbi:MAG: hypothetical protein FJW21_13710 [Acidimicrobiia bacterium]|nr:hypothetical protein [Acidimicrobiia bacterium]